MVTGKCVGGPWDGMTITRAQAENIPMMIQRSPGSARFIQIDYQYRDGNWFWPGKWEADDAKVQEMP